MTQVDKVNNPFSLKDQQFIDELQVFASVTESARRRSHYPYITDSLQPESLLLARSYHHYIAHRGGCGTKVNMKIVLYEICVCITTNIVPMPQYYSRHMPTNENTSKFDVLVLVWCSLPSFFLIVFVFHVDLRHGSRLSSLCIQTRRDFPILHKS